MTRLWNAPEDFADEMLDGFSVANSRWVRKIPGGVTRSRKDEEPTVAVVIGGGSGHYPAFAGLVGAGLAHGAAMGNLFASPSAHQVESVARASEQGRGLLLTFGNYAGDVLHFGAAQQTLRAEGIDCRTVLVTDDIFSAPADRTDQRRGIAGDLVVFKIAGAAAAAGYGLDDVERCAKAANDVTRTMGVAFTGCTLPGAAAPLFSVPEGRMAIGLGIHGEPGIDEVDIPSADELAELFVERLLAETEIPAGANPMGARVIPILNGLGSVKAEELFLVYRRVYELLTQRGLVVIDPQVGEFCTSFDMAGASLTLFWPDAELEELWLAPADTPGFRTSSTPVAAPEVERPDTRQDLTIETATAVSRGLAGVIADSFDMIRDTIDQNADELGRIDAIAGDGDHGIGMKRGAGAAAAAARDMAGRGAGAETTLRAAADAWSDKGGGTSGAIWGMMLRTLSQHAGNSVVPSGKDMAAAVSSAVEAVIGYGKAVPGDKTMVDALVPFAGEFSRRIDDGHTLGAAWRGAASAAADAAARTADLLPKLGRARSHGRKSLGVPDPGAVSFALIVTAVQNLVGSHEIHERTSIPL